MVTWSQCLPKWSWASRSRLLVEPRRRRAAGRVESSSCRVVRSVELAPLRRKGSPESSGESRHARLEGSIRFPCTQVAIRYDERCASGFEVQVDHAHEVAGAFCFRCVRDEWVRNSREWNCHWYEESGLFGVACTGIFGYVWFLSLVKLTFLPWGCRIL